MNTQTSTQMQASKKSKDFREVSTFRVDNNEARQTMFGEAAKFADAMVAGENPYWLVMLGVSDIGKTHLARELKVYAEKRLHGFVDPKNGNYWQKEFIFLDHRKFSKAIKGGDYDIVNRVGKAFFAVIDDLLASRDPSGFVLNETEDIINMRLGRWTVITSNHTMDNLRKKDMRIASRLRRNGSVILDIQTVPQWNQRKENQCKK